MYLNKDCVGACANNIIFLSGEKSLQVKMYFECLSQLLSFHHMVILFIDHTKCKVGWTIMCGGTVILEIHCMQLIANSQCRERCTLINVKSKVYMYTYIINN